MSTKAYKYSYNFKTFHTTAMSPSDISSEVNTHLSRDLRASCISGSGSSVAPTNDSNVFPQDSASMASWSPINPTPTHRGTQGSNSMVPDISSQGFTGRSRHRRASSASSWDTIMTPTNDSNVLPQDSASMVSGMTNNSTPTHRGPQGPASMVSGLTNTWSPVNRAAATVISGWTPISNPTHLPTFAQKLAELERWVPIIPRLSGSQEQKVLPYLNEKVRHFTEDAPPSSTQEQVAALNRLTAVKSALGCRLANSANEKLDDRINALLRAIVDNKSEAKLPSAAGSCTSSPRSLCGSSSQIGMSNYAAGQSCVSGSVQGSSELSNQSEVFKLSIKLKRAAVTYAEGERFTCDEALLKIKGNVCTLVMEKGSNLNLALKNMARFEYSNAFSILEVELRDGGMWKMEIEKNENVDNVDALFDHLSLHRAYNASSAVSHQESNSNQSVKVKLARVKYADGREWSCNHARLGPKGHTWVLVNDFGEEESFAMKDACYLKSYCHDGTYVSRLQLKNGDTWKLVIDDGEGVDAMVEKMTYQHHHSESRSSSPHGSTAAGHQSAAVPSEEPRLWLRKVSVTRQDGTHQVYHEIHLIFNGILEFELCDTEDLHVRRFSKHDHIEQHYSGTRHTLKWKLGNGEVWTLVGGDTYEAKKIVSRHLSAMR